MFLYEGFLLSRNHNTEGLQIFQFNSSYTDFAGSAH